MAGGGRRHPDEFVHARGASLGDEPILRFEMSVKAAARQAGRGHKLD